jgi:hypothetical protein
VGLTALAAALVAAGALLVGSPGEDAPPAGEAAVRTAEQVWPDADRADVPGVLPDGSAYSPAYFLDARTSLGTAPDPGGTVLRLVLWGGDAQLRELRRLPVDTTPQFSGFVRAGGGSAGAGSAGAGSAGAGSAGAGDRVAWAESVTEADGTARTRMWIADVASGGAPRQLTADTGDVVFFNSQYDMVIAKDRLYWTAVAPGAATATEVRSVPLAGGSVTVRTEPGAWALSAWPWLVSAGSGQSGPVQLRDLENGQVRDVNAAATELVTCAPAWCRVLVMAGDGPSRIDLMRPDGTDRRRVAGGAATASVIDVAVLDRFEVLSMSLSPDGAQQLLLYDAKSGETAVVADGVSMVLYRGTVLWWSTGTTPGTTTWHTLDLSTTPP